MLGRKGKHPVSGKLLLASCEPRLTHDSWGQVHTPDLKPSSLSLSPALAPQLRPSLSLCSSHRPLCWLQLGQVPPEAHLS